MSDLRVGCKNCGGEEIVGADIVMVSASISGWKRSDDGKFEPEWGGGSNAHWDSQTPEHARTPYYCKGCDRYIGDDDLVVVTEDEEIEE